MEVLSNDKVVITFKTDITVDNKEKEITLNLNYADLFKEGPELKAAATAMLESGALGGLVEIDFENKPFKATTVKDVVKVENYKTEISLG